MADFIVTPTPHLPRTVFRLAILECGTPLDKARKRYEGYGKIFESLLCASFPKQPSVALRELQTSIWNVTDDGAALPELDGVDGLLITGSKHDAFADTPWIIKLVRFVKQALSTSRIKVIGVCFGHQIVGRALGASVGRNNAWETGVVDIPLTRWGRRIFGQRTLTLHEMHQDVVFQCPPGVKLLGSTAVCPIQGMFVPRKLLTLQGHPEVNADIMSEVIDSRYERGIFTEDQWKQARDEVQKPHHGLEVGRAFNYFLLV